VARGTRSEPLDAEPLDGEPPVGGEPAPDGPTVAIVHDYLTQRGGAERVVLAMHRSYPGAPVHTALFDPDATFDELGRLEVRTSPLNRVGLLRRSHRLALPLLAPSFEAMRVEADVVLCSSSGWAHGVRHRGAKVVYCHAPARWLYQAERYLREVSGTARHVTRALGPPLRRWDRRAVRSATLYVTNSHYMRSHIAEVYGIDAEVVPPPHGVDPHGPVRPVAGLEPGYLLCVSRLLPYKNVDVVVRAMAALPDHRLVVVGRGPDLDRLSALAPSSTRFLSGLADDELRWVYRNARALVGASHEDFGLTPLEAAAFGVPSVVLRFGGYLDTVVEGVTGVFFDELHPAALAEAVTRADAVPFDVAALEGHAAGFAENVFRRRLQRVVTRAAGLA
jgi:glycosyltransferase involved in cell wall biosynthesis